MARTRWTEVEARVGCAGPGSGDGFVPYTKEDAIEDLEQLASTCYAAVANVEGSGGCAIVSDPPPAGWRETSAILAHDVEALRDDDLTGLGEAVGSDDLYAFGRSGKIEASRSSDVELLFLLRPYTEEVSTECNQLGFHLVKVYDPDPQSLLSVRERIEVVRNTPLTDLESVDPREVFEGESSDGP